MSSDNEDNDIDALRDIPPIGDLKCRVLLREGYKDRDDLKNADFEDLLEICEIGKRNASEILEGIDSQEGYDREEIFCPACGVILYADEESCPECEQSIKIQGKVFHSEGEIEEPLKALIEYEKRIIKGEENPELYYSKAAIIEKMGALNRALELYDKVIELDPLYDHIWTAKANLSLRLDRLNDAAKAYKVAVNKHQIDLPEMPEIREEKTAFEEKDIKVKEVETKVGDARRSYFRLKSGNIPTDHLESKLRAAVDARNNDDRETAVEKADELLDNVGEIKEISLDYEQALKEIKELGSETLFEKLEEIDDRIEFGKYGEAKKSCKDLLSDIEDEKKERALEQEISEKMGTVGKKKRISEEKFLKVFDEAKESLNQIRKTNIKINDIKRLIKMTVKRRKEMDYDEGINYAKQALSLSEKVKEIDLLIDEGREKLKKLKKMGGKIKPFLGNFREGKRLADEGKYEKAKDIYEKTIEDVDIVLDGGEPKMIYNIDPSQVKIESIKNLIETTKFLGMDTDSVLEYLEKIEQNDDNEDLLSEAREEIFKEFPDYMSGKVKSAKDELKEAKLSGVDIDVSRCIHLLKQARKAEKRGDYESAIENMKEYQEELDSD